MKNPFFYLAIFLISTSAQCRKENVPVEPTQTTVDTTHPAIDTMKTYLALGDSYTIGQSVNANERFPAQTVTLLRQAGISINDPRYIATTGWTTENLRQAIDAQMPMGPFSVVTLLIGVNDQYQIHDTFGYRLRFRNLLLTSISLAGNDTNRVFVLSIPDYSVTQFAGGSDTAFIHRQIDQFNGINESETLLASCHYLNITPSTREALYDPTLLANDGLHPSGKEYGKWAARLAPMMQTVLQ